MNESADSPVAAPCARDPHLRGARKGEHRSEGPRRAQRSEHDGRTHDAPMPGEHPPTPDEERLVRRDADVTRHFVTDLYQRVLDTATTATIEERFRLYAGSQPLGEIVRKDGSDETLFFHTDHLGSVDAISNDAGTSVRQEFDVFGTPIDPPSPDLTRAGYTGHQHERDLGLIDMKGRMYDPLAGRFLSIDPMIQAPYSSQGLNPYSYVFNDPINLVDPTGLAADGFTTLFGQFYPNEAASFGAYPGMGGGTGASGGTAAAPAGLSGASLAGFGLSAAANIGSTIGNGIGFGSGPAGSVGAPGGAIGSVQATQATTHATQGGTHATGQNDGRVGPNHIGTLPPSPRCKANPNAFGCGWDILPGPGGVVGGGGKAGATLLGRLFGALFGRGAAARAGVPLSKAIESGLVKSGGKLAQVLGGIEKGYAAVSPKTALDALGVVKGATGAAGVDVGVASVAKSGEIVLQNVGGVTTTLGTKGSILVERGSDILLHLIQ